jgi:hypothetical protein
MSIDIALSKDYSLTKSSSWISEMVSISFFVPAHFSTNFSYVFLFPFCPSFFPLMDAKIFYADTFLGLQCILFIGLSGVSIIGMFNSKDLDLPFVPCL